MIEPPTRAELEAALCWDASDLVPRRPAMTAFRQRTRLHQARWREREGHPIGSQPYAPRPGVDPRPVGSRIPLAYGRDTGANFLTTPALEAVKARTAIVEREQSIDHQRLWADLLSSEALAFNLFGNLAADLARADRLVHAWFADAPGRVVEVRFLHSPGRLEAQWLNSLRQFDAAFVLAREDGSQGIVAVDVTYHERLKAETPKPENLWRNREVHERSACVPARGIRPGEGPQRPVVAVARAPPAAVDAPAPGRRVDMGQVRDRPCGRQRRDGRSLRALCRTARGRDDVQVDHARGGSRDRRAPLPRGSSPPGSLPAAVASGGLQLSGGSSSGRLIAEVRARHR